MHRKLEQEQELAIKIATMNNRLEDMQRTLHSKPQNTSDTRLTRRELEIIDKVSNRNAIPYAPFPMPGYFPQQQPQQNQFNPNMQPAQNMQGSQPNFNNQQASPNLVPTIGENENQISVDINELFGPEIMNDFNNNTFDNGMMSGMSSASTNKNIGAFDVNGENLDDNSLFEEDEEQINWRDLKKTIVNDNSNTEALIIEDLDYNIYNEKEKTDKILPINTPNQLKMDLYDIGKPIKVNNTGDVENEIF